MGKVDLSESASAAGFQVLRPSLGTIAASGLATPESRWCAWRAEWADRPKPAKVPYCAAGQRLKVSAPSEWLTFDEACQLYEGGGFDGVGVLMGSLDFVVGLDLDNCLDENGNVIDAMSQVGGDFLGIGGYVEISPSGRGLRQFAKGCRLEDFREKTGNIEIYDGDSARYLTLTGHPLPGQGEAGNLNLNGAQARLETFIVKHMERVPDAPPLEFDAAEFGGNGRTAAEVLGLLRTHNKRGRVTRLLNGDLKDHDGDHSAADLALACEIAYFCRNLHVIDEVMRGSGLMRQKWDQLRGKATYGQRTIRRALSVQVRSFDADQVAKAAEAAHVSAIAAKAEGVITGGADDLRGPKGRLRTDAWALTELLIRDSRLLGTVYYDEFAGMPMVSRPLSSALGDRCAPREVGRMTDDHVAAFARWFGREWGLALKVDQVRAAVLGVAQAVRLNPIQDRLNELGEAWDGVQRLDGWLIRYLKASPTVGDADIGPYLQAVGARWLLSVVARGFEPGCKVDDMLILEGAQGARKSSAVRVLAEAVSPDCFREGFSLGMGKDDQVALRGRLIVEWAELSGLNRHDRNALKNFLTIRTDAYRSAYAVFERDWPRTAVFVGTTNDRSYLSDPTGNRRFLPVAVGRIDIDGLRRDAGQIVGEAVVRFRSGAKWWLDDDDPADARILAIARREQAGRVGSTFWSEVAAGLAERLIRGELFRVTGGDGVAVEVSPVEAFSVEQMRAWLGVSSVRSDGMSPNQNGNEAAIHDGNWPRVAEGLRLAGWESRKSNGRMVWHLTAEKRDELCLLFGRDVGPVISGVRRARREARREVSEAEK